jgi:ParB/Sulfiredoxin domain
MPDKEKRPDAKNLEPALERLAPEQLLFDQNNPRFGGQLSTKNQDEIQQAIFGEPHYASELVDSLVENGFIDYEPLIVKSLGDKFVVIEGNRRLAAVKHIRSNLERYPQRRSNLDSLPVLVFPEKTDDQQQNEMRVYLGIRHLLGFREWPPISKAQFLDRESKKPGGLDLVFKEVRITKQEVRRFLVPFRLLNAAGLSLPPGENFWVLGEALSRTGVKKFLQLDVDPNTMEVRSYDKTNLARLLDDLYGTKIPGTRKRDVSSRKVKDTRDLSTFAKVLASDKARTYLHSGKGLQEASIYVDTEEQSLGRLPKITREVAALVRRLASQNPKNPEAQSLLNASKHFEQAVKAFLKKHA